MSHPPRFDLDSLFMGRVAEPEAVRLREHVAACQVCGAYLEALDHEQDEQLRRLEPSHFATRVAARAKQDTPVRHLDWLGVGGLVGAVLGVLLGVMLMQRDPAPRPEPPRWMGASASVQVYVLRDGEPRPLGDAPIQVGDSLRFEVILPSGWVGHAAVFGLEGGVVTPILPLHTNSESIAVRERLLLPGSVNLGPGGGRVSLLLIVRPVPFMLPSAAESIRAALVQGAVPEGLVQRWEVDLGDAP